MCACVKKKRKGGGVDGNSLAKSPFCRFFWSFGAGTITMVKILHMNDIHRITVILIYDTILEIWQW